MKPSVAERQYPTLKTAWEEYGHSVAWEDLHDIKLSGTHGYAVLAFKDEEGDALDMADMASPDGGETWEMQNDGYCESITQAQWKKLKCVPDCDWFVIPGHPDFGGM